MSIKTKLISKSMLTGALLLFCGSEAKAYPFLYTLFNFTNSTSGHGVPVAKLLLGHENNCLYGTSWQGGNNNKGEIFKFTPLNPNSGILTGQWSSVASFVGTNGATPYAGLYQDAISNTLWGVTTGGGQDGSDDGVLFEIQPGIPAIQPDFTFNTTSSGLHPYSALTPIQDPVDFLTDHTLYGTANAGGSASQGTIYQYIPSNTFNQVLVFPGAVGLLDYQFYPIHQFTGVGSDGAWPFGPLASLSVSIAQGQGTFNTWTYNTNIWTTTALGTTWKGGNYDQGCIYEISNSYARVDVFDTVGIYRGSFWLHPLLLQSYQTLYSFTGGADGANPYAGLVQGSDGNFYGTTVNGGAYGLGTIFSYSPSSGSVTNLHSFSGIGEGANPQGELLLGPGVGNFYGTTLYGGTGNNGTIFNLRNTNTVANAPYIFSFANLYSFTGIDDGAGPFAGLTLTANGRIYCGTTGGSAGSGEGTIYEFIADAARVSVVADPVGGGTVNVGGGSVPAGGFSSAYGIYPVGQMVWITALATNGEAFYKWNDGITDNPRAITVPSNDVTYVASFRTNALVTVLANPANSGVVTGSGSYPIGSLQQITAAANTNSIFLSWNDGNTNRIRTILIPPSNIIYTATFSVALTKVAVVASPAYGGAGIGSGYYAIGSTQSISALANLSYAFGSWDDGNTSNPRIIIVPSNNITYTASFVSQPPVQVTVVASPSAGGTTTGTGSYVPGTTNAITIQANPGWTFNGWNDGSTQTTRSIVIPISNVTYTANLTQTSSLQVQAAPTLNTLYAFSGASDGASPRAGLVLGDDGYFYGTTYIGGAYGKGTIFKVNSSGSWITLRHLGTASNDGANPLATLLKGSGGYFYGTTYAGGSATLTNGTIFRINSAGNYTTMYSFNGGSDGANPSAKLLAYGNNLYGTTQSGGSNNNGTIFYLIPSWAELPLFFFSGGGDGGSPYAGLILGNDGNLYGTTTAGGTSSNGVAFKLTPSGYYPVSTLHTFTGSDGKASSASLIQAQDGYFYGTTLDGGLGGGNIFRMDTVGAVSNLHSLVGAEGVNPQAALVQGSDGNFYGTAQNGGANNFGTIFRLTTNGTFTSVYSFTGASDGANPWCELVQGSDGYFYGTTAAGGPNGDGTVFRIFIPAPATVTALAYPASGGVAWITASGSNIVLTASMNTGWTFVGWNDGNTNIQRTVTAPPTNITYYANFVAGPTAIVSLQATNNLGNVYGGGTYATGTTASISAAASLGWRFTGWSDGNPTNARSFTVVTNISLTAIFTNAPLFLLQDALGNVTRWAVNSAGTLQQYDTFASMGSWNLKAAGDMNLDGTADLFWQHTTGWVVAWLSTSPSNYNAVGLGNLGAWELRAASDVDGDGVADLIWQHTTGWVTIWLMNPDCTPNNWISLDNLGGWRLKAAGDVTGDGKADLFFQNSGWVVAYLSTPASPPNYTASVLGNLGTWELRAVADVDGDGIPDLIWQTPDNWTAVWYMNTDCTPRTGAGLGNTGAAKIMAVQ